MTLSIVMITKDSESVVGEAFESVAGLWDELLVSDDGSTDRTVAIVKRYGGKIFATKGKNLGERKQELIGKAKGDWVLVLDSDERLSPELKAEMQHVMKAKSTVVGYFLPYQNYIFGRPVYYGGEHYSKVRLFRRGYGIIEQKPIHEEVSIRGKIGELSGKIHHHSYRTFAQLFSKFTHYAVVSAREKQIQNESVNARKLFLYGPHMFWARYIKEKGYKDGIYGFILAFAFSYMEGLQYWFLLFFL